MSFQESFRILEGETNFVTWKRNISALGTTESPVLERSVNSLEMVRRPSTPLSKKRKPMRNSVWPNVNGILMRARSCRMTHVIMSTGGPWSGWDTRTQSQDDARYLFSCAVIMGCSQSDPSTDDDESPTVTSFRCRLFYDFLRLSLLPADLVCVGAVSLFGRHSQCSPVFIQSKK